MPGRIDVTLVALCISAGAAAAQPPAETTFAGRPLSAWIGDLDSKDVLVREEAVEVLAQIGAAAKPAVEKLSKMYREDEKMVRARCAWALWRIAKQTDPIFAVLRDSLTDNDRIVKLQALERVSHIGAAAVELAPTLIDMWKDPDPFLQSRATSIVFQFGANALPALIDALNHPDKEIQRRALDQFSTNRFRKEDVLPILRKKLDEPDLRLQVRVARLIRQSDPGDAKILTVLADATKHKDPAVRSEALQQCLMVYPRPKEFSDIFRRGMVEAEPGLRFRCAQALWESDRSFGKELIPPLLTLVKTGQATPDWHQAIALLGAMGPDAKEAIPVLAAVLNDGKAEGQEHFVIHTLARLGPASADLLVGFAQDSRPQYRAAASAALAQLGPAAVECLGPLMKHADVELRRSAFMAVHRVGVAVPSVKAQLETGVEDSDAQIRWMAAESLSRFGPDGKLAVPELTKRLRGMPGGNDYQIAQTALALSRIGADAKDALPLLRELQKKDDPNLKLRTSQAIARIEGKPENVAPAILESLKRRPGSSLQQTVVLRVLAEIRADPAAVAKAVLGELARSGPAFTETLVQTIAECWPEAKEFAPLYRDVLKSRSNLKLFAAQALLRLGDQQSVIDVLKDSISASDYNSRQLCLYAAIELGPEIKTMAPRVKEQWKSETSLSLRVRWAEALIRVDPETGKEALEWLRDQMRNGAAMSRQTAAGVLARIDPDKKDLLPVLREALKATQPHSRGPIIDAIGGMGPAAKSAVADLKPNLQVFDANCHLRTAVALWRIEGKVDDVLPTLLGELPGGWNRPALRGGAFQPTVAVEAARALAEIGPPAKGALPALRLATNADDERLRMFAMHAIRKIEGR